MQKSLRRGKVLVDWSQNDAKKTTVNAYSLRAQSAPTVSTPISWKELTRATNQKRILSFGPEDVLKRIAANGDFFSPLLHLKQKLPLLKSLAHL
jgi:bifunctional non-homologous end joining protein LigD